MNTLEENFVKLGAIPERQWFERRRLAQELMKKELDHSLIVPLKIPEVGDDFLNIFSFEYENDSFMYIEKISPVNPPVIHWFQIEKRIKMLNGAELGENVYRTKLLLASDDQAVTKGGSFFHILNLKKNR